MPIFASARVRPRFSEFAKNVGTLTLGAGLAQVFPLIFTPFLSRIYGPREFAAYAVFVSIVTLGTVFATAKYELAIVLPLSERDGQSVLQLCSALSIVLVACGVFLLTFARYAGCLRYIFLNGVNPFVVMVSLLFGGIGQSFSYWNNRKGRYRVLAVGRIVQSFLCMGIPVLSYGRLCDVNGLILGHTTGLAGSAFVYVVSTFRDDGLWRFAGMAPIKLVAKKYINMPRISMPHALMDAVQNNLLVILLGYYYGAALLGLYSFTFRILKSPMSIFGSSLSQVFYREAAVKVGKGVGLRRDVLHLLKILFFISLPIFGLLMCMGDRVVLIIFGDKWIHAGSVMKILAPWIFMNFILSPLTQVPVIVNEQKVWFFLSAGENVVIVMVITVMGMIGFSAMPMLSVLSYSNVLYLLIMLLWIYKISGDRGTSIEGGV